MSSAARYSPRAPRYVFRPEDESLMRYKGMENGNSQAGRAHVRDLSETGLSFVVDPMLAPFAGEMLKIEFAPPSGRRMAWYATVVRVEDRTEWDPELGDRKFSLVALQFRELPAQFSKSLAKSLGPRVSNDYGDMELDGKPAFEPLMMGVLTFALALALTLMAMPPPAAFSFFHR